MDGNKILYDALHDIGEKTGTRLRESGEIRDSSIANNLYIPNQSLSDKTGLKDLKTGLKDRKTSYFFISSSIILTIIIITTQIKDCLHGGTHLKCRYLQVSTYISNLYQSKIIPIESKQLFTYSESNFHSNQIQLKRSLNKLNIVVKDNNDENISNNNYSGINNKTRRPQKKNLNSGNTPSSKHSKTRYLQSDQTCPSTSTQSQYFDTRQYKGRNCFGLGNSCINDKLFGCTSCRTYHFLNMVSELFSSGKGESCPNNCVQGDGKNSGTEGAEGFFLNFNQRQNENPGNNGSERLNEPICASGLKDGQLGIDADTGFQCKAGFELVNGVGEEVKSGLNKMQAIIILVFILLLLILVTSGLFLHLAVMKHRKKKMEAELMRLRSTQLSLNGVAIGPENANAAPPLEIINFKTCKEKISKSRIKNLKEASYRMNNKLKFFGILKNRLGYIIPKKITSNIFYKPENEIPEGSSRKEDESISQNQSDNLQVQEMNKVQQDKILKKLLEKFDGSDKPNMKSERPQVHIFSFENQAPSSTSSLPVGKKFYTQRINNNNELPDNKKPENYLDEDNFE